MKAFLTVIAMLCSHIQTTQNSETGFNVYLNFDEDDGEVSAHISTKSAEESEENSDY